MSYLLDTRDALAQAVRDLFPGYPAAFVVAEWLIEIDREKLTYPQIHIAPYQRIVTNAARGMNKFDLKFVMVYAQPIGTDADQAIEAAQIVVETLDAVQKVRINGFICTAVDQQFPVDKDELTKNSAAKTTVLIHLEKASL